MSVTRTTATTCRYGLLQNNRDMYFNGVRQTSQHKARFHREYVHGSNFTSSTSLFIGASSRIRFVVVCFRLRFGSQFCFERGVRVRVRVAFAIQKSRRETYA